MQLIRMKANRKEIISAITIATAAVVFALTLMISADAAAVDGDRLLLGLALCGAIAGGINGFGRRMQMAEVRTSHTPQPPQRMIAFPS